MTGRELDHRSQLGELLGASPEMQLVYTLIEKVSQHNFPVLILGESGTGKELVARAIHQLGSRAHNRFTPLDCSALTPALIESELFGHHKGSFTGATHATEGLFQASHKGTIFLDEIGELPIHLQAKLLRVIQEGVVRPIGSTAQILIDARAIAATNRNLESMIRGGTFRQDLYFRLSVVEIHVPPLRKRKDDIPLLASHFLERFARAENQPYTVSREAMQQLCLYDWPGNVRELENAIQRAIALSATCTLQSSDLPPNVRGRGQIALGNIQETLCWDDLERVSILRALEETCGDRVAAARLLGIGKTTLYRKLKIYGENAPLNI